MGGLYYRIKVIALLLILTLIGGTTMAYRQYIGARYVPLYDGNWSATKNYEPLTIVDDGNGNSYTSKKDVPAGTPLNDREYWIQTSSFSGAITQLQNRMNTAENDIDGLENDVTDINNEIASLASAGEVLTISDSYGTIVNGQGKTAADLFGMYCGVTVRQYAQGGASFKTGSLLDGLRSFTTPDDSKIKTVIIFCGANDAFGSRDIIVDGIVDMASYIRTRFTNVKKIALCCCGLTMKKLNGSAPVRNTVIGAYIDGAYLCGMTFIENSYAVFHNTYLLQADKTHPTTGDGVTEMAKMLVAAYRGDSVSVNYDRTITMSQSSESPENFTLTTGSMQHSIDNNIVTLKGRNPHYGILAFNSGSGTISLTQNTLYTLADLSDTMVDCTADNPTDYFTIDGLLGIYGESAYVPCQFNCVIEDQKLKGQLVAKYNPSATIDNITGFISTTMQITLPVASY